MAIRSKKWCRTKIKSKQQLHAGDWKSVLFRPRIKYDTKPWECSICKQRFTYDELGLKKKKSFTYKSKKHYLRLRYLLKD